MADARNYIGPDAVKGASVSIAATVIDGAAAEAIGKPNNYWPSANPLKHGLKDHVAIVTGVDNATCRAICVALAQQGVNVFGIYLTHGNTNNIDQSAEWHNKMLGLQKHITGLGVRFDYGIANIHDYNEMGLFAQNVVRKFGKVDIIIADTHIATAEISTDQQHRSQAMGEDILHASSLLEAFVPLMMRQNYGRIVTISSRRHKGNEGLAGSASQWALTGLVKSAASALSAHNVTVNAVMHDYSPKPAASAENWRQGAGRLERDSIRHHKTETLSPTGRTFTTENQVPDTDAVASTVVFLVSEAAGIVSGAVYDGTGVRMQQYSS